MTGRIISLHGDLHDDACALLPWYATGRLDAEDVARVEAHLPTCTQCQADLIAERRLQAAVAGLDEATGDVDAAARGATVEHLRHQDTIVLAEPIDAGDKP